MNFDISNLLENWDYQPGQIIVRKFTGRDGQPKIQLRVDLGLLQMNVHGRPDGKKPMGHTSLFEYHETRLKKYMEEHGSDDHFVLKAEDCAKLQLERKISEASSDAATRPRRQQGIRMAPSLKTRLIILKKASRPSRPPSRP